MIHRKLKILLALFMLSAPLYAQKPNSVDDALNSYYRAAELYTNRKYNAAAGLFQQFIDLYPNHPVKPEALFLKAMCASELYHPDAIAQFQNIQELYPGSQMAHKSVFQVIRCHYRDKKYAAIAPMLATLKTTWLDPSDLQEFYMINGFTNYKNGAFEEAQKAFSNLSEDSGTYYFDANYYKGYIHYLKQEDAEAIASFLKILKQPYYGQVAPSYLAQLYLKHQKYREAFDLTDTITRKELIYDAMHTAAVAAYHLKDYSKSAEKFERYYKASKPMSDTDWYLAGKAHAMQSEYDKAIYAFNKVKNQYPV
jgi:TolA-binding protein